MQPSSPFTEAVAQAFVGASLRTLVLHIRPEARLPAPADLTGWLSCQLVADETDADGPIHGCIARLAYPGCSFTSTSTEAPSR